MVWVKICIDLLYYYYSCHVIMYRTALSHAFAMLAACQPKQRSQSRFSAAPDLADACAMAALRVFLPSRAARRSTCLLRRSSRSMSFMSE